tara:strand:- start:3 stop:227 length:225 start_codon:yes stop_codon:yes gene_type:complete
MDNIYNNNIIIICNDKEELKTVLKNNTIKKQLESKEKSEKKETRLTRLQLLELIKNNIDRLNKKDVLEIVRGYS